MVILQYSRAAARCIQPSTIAGRIRFALAFCLLATFFFNSSAFQTGFVGGRISCVFQEMVWIGLGSTNFQQV